MAQTIKELYVAHFEEYEFKFVSKSDLDISNKEDIEKLLRSSTFHYCINCAAYTNVELAEDEGKEEAFKINAEAVKTLASLCFKYNIILLHISTDYVFDGTKNTPYCEDDQTNPINQYGKSKLLGEQHIVGTMTNYFIIRTSWLYSKYGKNFVKTIINKVQDKANLKITTDQCGTPTSCIDLAQFLFHLIKNNPNYGLYHFSALGETTWYGFATCIASNFKQYDSTNIKPTTHFSTKAKRPDYSVSKQ